MYTIYFIFYQCTNILINLCTLIAYSLMTPHEKKKNDTKKATVCFCKSLGTISNAIDVFALFFFMYELLFRVWFLSLESDLQTESASLVILVSDGKAFILFFSLSPWVKVKEAREGC